MKAHQDVGVPMLQVGEVLEERQELLAMGGTVVEAEAETGCDKEGLLQRRNQNL